MSENPCMLFITITKHGPQIWAFCDDYAIMYLTEHVKLKGRSLIKGVHRIPRNYPTLFLTSQMLRKTWVCSGCRVYLNSAVQHLPQESSRAKITNDYAGTKDEYCLETKHNQVGRHSSVHLQRTQCSRLVL
jgi:hypothetical protein